MQDVSYLDFKRYPRDRVEYDGEIYLRSNHSALLAPSRIERCATVVKERTL
jgi:hypothetical protein